MVGALCSTVAEVIFMADTGIHGPSSSSLSLEDDAVSLTEGKNRGEAEQMIRQIRETLRHLHSRRDFVFTPVVRVGGSPQE